MYYLGLFSVKSEVFCSQESSVQCEQLCRLVSIITSAQGRGCVARSAIWMSSG